MPQTASRILLQGLCAACLLATVDPHSASCQNSGSVSGRVIDSLSHHGLAGALVQLLSADEHSNLIQTTASDSAGHFELGGLSPGRYALGFADPLLDSLGIAVPLKEIELRDGDSLTVDLGVPSSRTLIAAACGKDQIGAAAIGTVRKLDGSSATGAHVTAAWMELTLGKHSMTQGVKRVSGRMGADGWYLVCSLPTTGTVALSAVRESQSTGSIEIDVPSNGLIRRDLYLGESLGGSIGPTGTGSAIRLGRGALSGLVRAIADRKPIVDAHVSILEGPTTTTQADGTWSLANLPTGTQVLEVRAIGYYPKRLPVDVVAESKTLTIELPTLKSILDTIKITARRSPSDLEEFARRRRIGGGHFLTPEDIARFPATITSDLFRTIPGVRLTLRDGQRFIQLRSMFEPWCSPGIFVDGHNMSFMSADDLDDYVSPKHVAGIEVYTGAVIPPQYQIGLRGCGSIVVWTR